MILVEYTKPYKGGLKLWPIIIRLQGKYCVTEILESLRKASCSHIKENYYVFDFFDEVLEELGKDLNIDFSKKFMKLKEIKKVLGETKKGDFSL